MNESSVVAADRLAAASELSTASKAWTEFCKEEVTDAKLRELFPDDLEETAQGEKLDVLGGMMKVDIKPLFDFVKDHHDKHKCVFGLLPLMMGNSECQLGALSSQEFQSGLEPNLH